MSPLVLDRRDRRELLGLGPDHDGLLEKLRAQGRDGAAFRTQQSVVREGARRELELHARNQSFELDPCSSSLH